MDNAGRTVGPGKMPSPANGLLVLRFLFTLWFMFFQMIKHLAAEWRNAGCSRRIIFAASLSVAALLLFARLGHYSLWSDESHVALISKGVLATGDTSAVLEHGNIVAYGNGILLHNLHDRNTPPLAAYLTAASFAVLGADTWTARLPFSLLGLATIALILYWARKQPPAVLLMLALGLACNVSLILSLRQCRYYAPAVFFSTLAAYLYWHWQGGRRGLLSLAAASVLLFASNYMSCAILYGCMFFDYLLWRRREHPLTVKDWCWLLAPTAIGCGALLLVWNPWKTGVWTGYASDNDFADKLKLVWWYFRDLNVNEFYPLLALPAAAVLGFRSRIFWRLALAVSAYIVLLGIASPQSLRTTTVADVRYAGPVIPLAVALAVAIIWCLSKRRPWVALAAALAVFATNLANLGASGGLLPAGVRSTIVSFVRELAVPPPEPYGPVAAWLNENVPDGGTVWVSYWDAICPLMFAAPRVQYVWQLEESRRAEPQFASLPAAHFKRGGVVPDYLLGFGPYTRRLDQDMQNYCPPGLALRYQQVAHIDVLWKDLYRPELFWRTFSPVTNYDKNRDTVFIFKRIAAPGTGK